MDHQLGGRADLAERIKRERAARGWSAARLVEEMEAFGISAPRSAITKMEAGQREVSAHELWALSRAFETTPDDLLRPIALVDQERAVELLEARQAANDAFTEAVSRVVEVEAALADEYADNHEVWTWVYNQANHRIMQRPAGSDPADRLHVNEVPEVQLAVFQLRTVLIEWASHIIETAKGTDHGKR